jgi:hypothetical protein
MTIMRAGVWCVSKVCFCVTVMSVGTCFRRPAGLMELRGKMNARAKGLILGWLKEKGLAPDAKSELGRAAAGHRRQRRTLLSPMWLLSHSAEAFDQHHHQFVMSAGEG